MRILRNELNAAIGPYGRTVIMLVPLIFLMGTSTILAQDLTGDWTGKLETPVTLLDVTFHFTKVDTGYHATMDILQQGLSEYPVTATAFRDSILHLSLPEFGMTYDGKLNDQQVIEGHINQHGATPALNLKSGKPLLNRPQEPTPPFPYSTQDVEFVNEKANITLKGTLTRPDKDGVYPLAIIISGSGPQNRDGLIFAHKPYLVLADHLTRHGIAVFRFDERGVGESEGRFETSGLDDFASDVEAALDHLESQMPTSFSHVGLIGHSIGGIIAPRIATERKDIDFLVLMAAPGVPGDELMLTQKADMERSMGINDLQIAQGQRIIGGAYKVVTGFTGQDEALRDSLGAYFLRELGFMVPQDQRSAIVDQLMKPEILGLLRSDPKTYLNRVSCPVLAINGSKDFQVAAEPNLTAIEKAVKAGGNDHVRKVTFKGLNHLFQESDTGLMDEYGEIEQTISPEVLTTIADWIGDQLH